MGTARQPRADRRAARPAPRPPGAGPERQLLRDAAVLRVYATPAASPSGSARSRSPPRRRPGPCARRPPPAHLTMILGTYPDLLEEWLRALAGDRPRDPGHAHPGAAGRRQPRRRGARSRSNRCSPSAPAGSPQQHGPWAWAAGGDAARALGDRHAPGAAARARRRARPRPGAAARELIACTFGQRQRPRPRGVPRRAPRRPRPPPTSRSSSTRSSDRAAGRPGAGRRCCCPRSPAARSPSGCAARARPASTQAAATLPSSCPARSRRSLRRDGLTGNPPQRHGPRRLDRQPDRRARAAATRGTSRDDPGKLLGRRVADGMGDVLRDAWAAAAVRQRDARWAAALLDRGVAPTRELRRRAASPAAAGERHALRRAQEARRPARDWLADAIPAPVERGADPQGRRADRSQPSTPAAGRRRSRQHGDPRLADQLAAARPASDAGLHLRVAAAKLALRRTMLDTLKENTPA